MAAYVSSNNKENGCFSFTISTPSDLALLPTQTQGGTGSLAHMKPILGGDALCVSNGSVYILDDDSWKLI